ncbi:MAG: hypothetical protein ACM37U_02310, partial [Gemmatimonas sp.]
DKITLTDIMPRHLRSAGEVPTSLTIQVGSSVSDAKRQLALRTFASTGGDAARAAKLLGVSADEVRRELMQLVNGAPRTEDDGEEAATNGKHPKPDAVIGSRPAAAKKPVPKKR